MLGKSLEISSGLEKHSNGSIKSSLSTFSALLGLLCGSPLVFQFLRKVIVYSDNFYASSLITLITSQNTRKRNTFEVVNALALIIQQCLSRSAISRGYYLAYYTTISLWADNPRLKWLLLLLRFSLDIRHAPRQNKSMPKACRKKIKLIKSSNSWRSQPGAWHTDPWNELASG